MQYAVYDSPLGKLLLAWEEDGLHICRLWGTVDAGWEENKEHPICSAAFLWLDSYFAGRDLPPVPPLAPEGTAFQLLVWKQLRVIPWGSWVSYGTIAREIEKLTGNRASAQAVGGAVGRNPLLLFQPCHRVLGAKGQLTGFACGLEVKRWLLQHENIPYV